MSAQRRRGLVRLGILLGSIAGLIVLGVSAVKGGGGSKGEGPTGSAGPPPSHLAAAISSAHLPVALHGLSLARTVNGLLVAGGANAADISTDRVYRFDPRTGKVSGAGRLVQPLHDAVAATLNRETLVFGGGNTATLDLVQALEPGAIAQTVGRLPEAVSDLSAVVVGRAVYIFGGFNGTTPSPSVLRTTDGRTFTRVARLPVPVRYAAVAATQDKIYVFGGELASGRDTSDIQEYDIATERSVIAGHLSEPVSHASAVSLDGGLYLIGGRRAGGASDRILRFDPRRNVALPAGRLPVPVFDGAARTYGDHAYLVGGLGPKTSPLDTVISLGGSAAKR
jgi:Kelch motif protein